jgi:hypothetical protein
MLLVPWTRSVMLWQDSVAVRRMSLLEIAHSVTWTHTTCQVMVAWLAHAMSMVPLVYSVMILASVHVWSTWLDWSARNVLWDTMACLWNHAKGCRETSSLTWLHFFLACGCSALGSVNGTVCSNDDQGMCVCKPGVSGRACDSCQKMYTNFSSAGCSRKLKIKTINYHVILLLNRYWRWTPFTEVYHWYFDSRKLNEIFFCTGCSECPRNLQYVLNGAIEKFLNVTSDVERLQIYSQIGEFFEKTTSRLEMANVRRSCLKLIEPPSVNRISFV